MPRPFPPRSSTQGYAEEADALAAQYESITFADVHRDTLHLMPVPPSRVLDIGAGTGRDAAALRDHGRRLHPETTIEWLDDGLPELSRVLARGEQFDLILLTAVWMHLEVRDREVAMERLARLIAPSAPIIMSLRHGPVPAGRQMFDVSFEETDELAQQHGLRATFRCEREGLLGRTDVRWTFLALTAGA